ncbi:hypothetical protein BCR33DRAFT_833178 [Rhizoclosmatium globosum]|uniref:DDE Tnp4 domain-containing protein n=1 Tax=Rhizoclosmatium globosum TaxID=329046 RepID=A0A1Y2BSM9_9FUNG|nr:hypothetical protein BCR33DRAFT_833178 [Rhizoclosmatium globosum]|eukprot:ORY37759.1 hypothetical protein BCR33DRAFT_833178 [Rhizoclosmatium globosum]
MSETEQWTIQLPLMVNRAAPLINLSSLLFQRNRRVWCATFKSVFGLSIESAVDLWILVAHDVLKAKLTKVHFLWCLNWLKEYNTDWSSASRFKTSPSNWRNKIWQMVRVFNKMDVIDWESRFDNWRNLRPSCYVDGTDCPINEVQPFDPSLFSHKFKHAGLCYQVAVAIATSKIVFVAGGVPCGQWSDLKMAQHSIVPHLKPGEKLAADGGYVDSSVFYNKVHRPLTQAERIQNHNLNLMASRHEILNGRLKDFHILRRVFRGSMADHHLIFKAVAQITQVKLRREPLHCILNHLIYQ